MATSSEMIEGIVKAMPNLTALQSKKCADFLNGSGMELLNEPELFKTVINTSVGFYLEKFREFQFIDPLTNLGIFREGSNLGFSLQRIYCVDDTNQPDDPAFLKGPRTAAGVPLTPMKFTSVFKQRFVPTNLAFQIWTTIWDDWFFSTVDGSGRMSIIAAITNNLWKKYNQYKYAVKSAIISNSYDTDKLKDNQIQSVDLGAADYLNVTGDGAINFVQCVEQLEYVASTIGYKDFNEESFQDYWKEGDYVICVRPGFKNAIRKALMQNNYFAPDYVQSKIDKLVEIPVALTPCHYSLKADGTVLYPVYAVESDTTVAGNGVVIGLSTTEGQTGTEHVEYQLNSDLVTYTESDTSVFCMIIDKERLNWITGPGGEISSEMTVRDAFNKCSDLVCTTLGVNNSDGVKVGASVFIDRSYPVIYVKDSHEE